MNVSSANAEYFAIAFLDCESPDIPDIAISTGVIRFSREVQASNKRLAVGSIGRSMNSAFFWVTNAVASWMVSQKNITGMNGQARTEQHWTVGGG